jgi:competence protein ComEC
MLYATSFEAMITGDLARVSERIIIEREALPDIELLVAGHHGSKESSSEAFLKAVNPETAVISVGNNNYGHPSPETLKRLAANNVRVYRTDREGLIEIGVKD